MSLTGFRVLGFVGASGDVLSINKPLSQIETDFVNAEDSTLDLLWGAGKPFVLQIRKLGTGEEAPRSPL